MKQRIAALLLAVVMCLSLTACGGEKIYRVEKDELYCYGESLDGPSKVEPDKCYLIVNGDNVEYHHYAYIFTGTISSGYVLWDEDPEMLAGGTHAYTRISERSKGGYILTISYKYPLDDGTTAYIDNEISFAK